MDVATLGSRVQLTGQNATSFVDRDQSPPLMTNVETIQLYQNEASGAERAQPPLPPPLDPPPTPKAPSTRKCTTEDWSSPSAPQGWSTAGDSGSMDARTSRRLLTFRNELAQDAANQNQSFNTSKSQNHPPRSP